MSIADDVSSNLLTAAHEYRDRGWRVIQLHSVGPDGSTCSCKRGGNCTSKGKHPRDNAWQKTAPYSAPDIEALWEDRPKANIGLATGPASGFWVLDIDPDSNGLESMKALTDANGRLPQTFVVQTGSGGYHYYFSLPDFELRNSAGRVGEGIDVRAAGGQVVAAPSRTDKGVYTVLADCAPSSAPDWLLELVRKDQPQGEVITAEDLPKPEDIEPAEWERLNAYTKRAVASNLERLDKLKAEGWDGAPWDATTFEVACSLVELANSPWNAYSLGQAEQDLVDRAPRDDEGFDTWKVKQKFSSARERVGDKARAMPEGRQAPAQDPLFSGIEDRSTNPTGAGPVFGDRPGVLPDPASFFGEGGLQASSLASAVMSLGPIGWGRDEDFWSYSDGVWVPDHYVVENRVIALLGDLFRTGHVNNVRPIVRNRAFEISADPHPKYLNFQNGMLNWRTGELHPHSPEFCSTVQFPVPYDEHAECPTFDRFLHDVMHDDYVHLAWQMLGYLLFSGNPLQVAFMFYGSGGNGKGTLMRVIEDMIGRENIASESLDDLNGNRFSAVNLFGKIANLAGDIDGTYQESTANFKKLTGEDTYAGERKFGQRFNFQSWAVPVFSANKIPGSADVTEGYLRRWVILHFHKRITNMIPGFSDRLSEEIPGIAAKAVSYLRPLMEAKAFSIDGEARKGKEEFALAIDQVRQWVASGDPLTAPEHHEPVIDLYNGYKAWAERSGQGRLKLTEFSHRLEAIGYPSSRVAGIQGHTGLKVQAPTHSGASMASFF